MKKISVCVLTYNHEKYIQKCLDSILEQKCDFDFEVLIGEDESSDETRTICRKYAEKYPDIIRLYERSRKDVIYIEGSPTGRFNFISTLKEASSEYIAICEGDDFWTDRNKLQIQVDYLDKDKSAVAIFHNVEYFDEVQDKKWLFHPEGWKEKSGTEDLCRRNFIATTSLVFRNPGSEFNFPKWYFRFRAGDWALHLLNSLRGDVVYINRVMAVYRHNAFGAWGPSTRIFQLESAVGMFDILLNASEFVNFKRQLLHSKKELEKELKRLKKSKKVGYIKLWGKIKSIFKGNYV